MARFLHHTSRAYKSIINLKNLALHSSNKSTRVKSSLLPRWDENPLGEVIVFERSAVKKEKTIYVNLEWVKARLLYVPFERTINRKDYKSGGICVSTRGIFWNSSRSSSRFYFWWNAFLENGPVRGRRGCFVLIAKCHQSAICASSSYRSLAFQAIHKNESLGPSYFQNDSLLQLNLERMPHLMDTIYIFNCPSVKSLSRRTRLLSTLWSTRLNCNLILFKERLWAIPEDRDGNWSRGIIYEVKIIKLGITLKVNCLKDNLLLLIWKLTTSNLLIIDHEEILCFTASARAKI